MLQVVLGDEDPGWPLTKDVLLGLVPGVGFLVRRRAAANGLALLRQVFMSFCLALVMLGVVLAFLWPSQSTEPESPGLAIGLIALGAAAGIGGRFIEKPLRCSDDVVLASSYRSRFFLRIAIAESAAMFGFVGFFVASVWWVYPAGAVTAFAGFARAAPTRARLHRDQEQLNEQGCLRSLVTALSRAAPPRH